MGFGRGKGKANEGAIIASSCCAIYCVVCFLLVGLPFFGLGIAFIRVGAGDYDDQVRDDNNICGEDTSFFDYVNNEEDAGCLKWEDWENTKDVMRIIGIVLLIVALLFLVAAIVMLILMCTTICGSRNRSNNTQGMVLAQPNQGGYPQQGYPQQGYPQQGYAQQGYPQQNQGYTPEPYMKA